MKILKNFISLCLGFCLIVPTMGFAAGGTDLPKPKNDGNGGEVLIYSQNFDSVDFETLSDAKMFYDGSTTQSGYNSIKDKSLQFTGVSVSDGKLSVNHNKNGALILPIAFIYDSLGVATFQSDGALDDLVLEFEVGRQTSSKRYSIRVGNRTQDVARDCDIFINKENVLETESDGNIKTDYEKLTSKFIIYLKSKNGKTPAKLSVWLDGEKIVDNVDQSIYGFGEHDTKQITRLGLKLIDTGIYTFDNFKVYLNDTGDDNTGTGGDVAQPNPLDSLRWQDINGGSADSAAAKTLYLPAETDSGDKITWSSKNGYIEIDGDRGYLRGLYTGESEDVLIASVDTGGTVFTKEFSMTLPLNEHPLPTKDSHGNDEIIFSEDFNSKDYAALSDAKMFYNGHTDDEGYAKLTSLASVIDGIEVADGKLNLIHGGGAKLLPIAFLYDSEGKATYKYDRPLNELVVKFDLERESSSKRINIRIGNRTGEDGTVFDLEFARNNVINFNGRAIKSDYKNTKSSFVIYLKSDSKTNKAPVTATVWLDGEKIIDNELHQPFSSVISSDYIGRLVLRLIDKSVYSIDNLEVYQRAEQPKDEAKRVLSYYDKLDKFSLSEDGRLTLINKADIDYSNVKLEFAGDGKYIKSDGSIDYPLTDTADTLYVRAEHDGYSESLSYPVILASNYKITKASHIGVEGLRDIVGRIYATCRRAERDGETVRVTLSLYEQSTAELLIDEETLIGQTLGDLKYFVGYIEGTNVSNLIKPKLVATLKTADGELINEITLLD